MSERSTGLSLDLSQVGSYSGSFMSDFELEVRSALKEAFDKATPLSADGSFTPDFASMEPAAAHHPEPQQDDEPPTTPKHKEAPAKAPSQTSAPTSPRGPLVILSVRVVDGTSKHLNHISKVGIPPDFLTIAVIERICVKFKLSQPELFVLKSVSFPDGMPPGLTAVEMALDEELCLVRGSDPAIAASSDTARAPLAIFTVHQMFVADAARSSKVAVPNSTTMRAVVAKLMNKFGLADEGTFVLKSASYPTGVPQHLPASEFWRDEAYYILRQDEPLPEEAFGTASAGEEDLMSPLSAGREGAFQKFRRTFVGKTRGNSSRDTSSAPPPVTPVRRDASAPSLNLGKNSSSTSDLSRPIGPPPLARLPSSVNASEIDAKAAMPPPPPSPGGSIMRRLGSMISRSPSFGSLRIRTSSTSLSNVDAPPSPFAESAAPPTPTSTYTAQNRRPSITRGWSLARFSPMPKLLRDKERPSAASNVLNDTIRRGWLMKRGGSWRSWVSRMCSLTPMAFFYFDSEDALSHGHWRGFFPLADIVKVEVASEAQRAHVFKISLATREYYFQCADQLDLAEWVEAFKVPMRERGDAGQDGAGKAASSVTGTIGTFDLGAVIGVGAYAEVRFGYNRMTNFQTAVKVIQNEVKNTGMMSRLAREIEIMRSFDHPNVIRLLDVVQHPDYTYIVMEYVPGQTLDDFVFDSRDGWLPESAAKFIFRQLAAAVEYIQMNNIVHRDLKMENVLVGHNGDVRLIDFGLSNIFRPDHFLRTFCGTIEYAAPEMVGKREYLGPPTDVWSMGIILYIMVTGEFPFGVADADDPKPTIARIQLGHVDVDFPSTLSSTIVTLIRSMLESDPRDRATTDHVIMSEWMNDDEPLPDSVFEEFFSGEASAGTTTPLTPRSTLSRESESGGESD